MRELAGRVGVVTGAGAGIGLAIAQAFVGAGMRVALADLPSSVVADEAACLRADGADVISVHTDVRDEAQVEGLAAATIEAFGAVHVLCNNAGIVVRLGCPSWEWPESVWDDVLAVNLRGVIHGLKAFVPRMLSGGEEGHIVNMASMAAVMVPPYFAPYCVSKHGVLGLSESLSKELAALTDKVKVTVVFPGGVSSPMGWSGLGKDQVQPPGMIEPSTVADKVLEAIRANQEFLFTHPERIIQAEQRLARIVAADRNH